MEDNTTGVLSTFGLSEFNPTQETEEEKASYEEAPASISCFSEVAVTQDDGDLARFDMNDRTMYCTARFARQSPHLYT